MEKTKQSKGLIWLIIILIIIILGLVGFIIYDKIFINSNNNINPTNNSTAQSNITTNKNIQIIGTKTFTIDNNKMEIDFIYKDNIEQVIYALLKINNNKIGEYIVENYSSIDNEYVSNIQTNERNLIL